MKKFGYFFALLIVLSACTAGPAQKAADDLPALAPQADLPLGGDSSISTSGANPKSTGDPSTSAPEVNQTTVGSNMAADLPPSSVSEQAADPAFAAQPALAVTQTGEALTPFQLQLEQALGQRKAAGLPVPVAVTYEYEATSRTAIEQIAGSATTPTGPTRIVSMTIVVFEGPEQAGYDEWPALVVKDNLPQNAQGTVAEGDYTEAYRNFMEEKVPGFWEKYEFGHEPRMHTIVETIETTYPEKNILTSDSMPLSPMATSEQLLMGFTYTGPHLNYYIEDSWSDPIFGIEIYYFKAGLELDWALGLRLPGEADLTGPDQLTQGSAASLSSTFTPLDWAVTTYSNSGVAAEKGNEFVLRMSFFVGVEGHLLGVDLCSWCHVTLDKDFSESFTTPFGSGASFPISPVDIPIYEFDLSVFYFGAGFQLDPQLGSSKLTANWEASGDASGSGLVTFGAANTPVSFGPVNTCNLGPTSLAEINMHEFRYWFNQFLLELNTYLKFELFGYGVWNPTYSIAKFDLSPLTGDLYLGSHKQCDWKFNCSNAGPDNTLNLSIPVVDLTPPTTTLTAVGTAGNHSWYTSDVQVSLNATDLPADCGASVKQTEYSLDGVSWNAYSAPFTINTEGITTVHYRSTDNDGNVEPANTQAIKIDKTPPTITGAATTMPNAYGWYNTDVIVHFQATDVVSGIDTVTPDQTLSGEAANQSVTGTVVDMAGFTASLTVTGINIDKTQPNLAISSPEARVYENTETFNVLWTASDSLSGMASETGTLDGVAITNGQPIDLLILVPGPHTVTVEAADKAGNTTSASVVFSVSMDGDGLLAALQHMCELGWIEKNGICNSLAAKLEAAIKSMEKDNLNAAENQLNAFLNELEAQTDKSINEAAYQVLQSAAVFVIEHLHE